MGVGVRYIWSPEKTAQKARLSLKPDAPVVQLFTGESGRVVSRHPECRSGVLVQWDGATSISHVDIEYLGAP
jgi:hypothetical protein